ncbi:LysE/ArgO family amino acid transporter [Demequina sp. NBRC 110056]|uniref:LysE/ArgO family amino acid transporter n=1 Tax=Demequina sp. NBRC 110056 TaxID=1570345 RepID=UPI0009FCAB90|nr:LysE/ArgO family amino acid transporter [Demequina sp. NBRC 110056]
MTTFLAGLGLGLSLIVAIGAQNVFVLRQGIRREHVALVVVICAASDAVLIAAGIGGLGAAVTAHPGLVTAARIGGAAFLLGYAVLAARRAWRPAPEALEVAEVSSAGRDAGSPPSEPGPVRTQERSALGTSARAVAVTALALTWLNPHVYLDTVLLLGTVGASQGDAAWVFGAGAMVGSVLWFSALGYGSRLLSGVLARPRAWRVLDGVIAVIMVVLAISLLAGA